MIKRIKNLLLPVKIKEYGLSIDGKVRYILEHVETKERIVSPWHKNLITTAGKTAIARRIVNGVLRANEGILATYGAVGTGTTTPTAGSVLLSTELVRVTVSSAEYSSNVVNVSAYFTSTQANGILKEYGLFGEEASASANTGTLFEIVAINITKTSAYTLTIESQITIS